MDTREGIDSVIRYLTDRQILAGLVFFLLFVGSLGVGAYTYAQQSSSIKCLGCLALTPIVEDFDDWWITHPATGATVDHPSWVRTDLNNYEVVFIFLWSNGCLSCEAQWEDMKEYGLVTGEEDGGDIAKYQSTVSFYSLNAGDGTKGTNAISTYDPNGGSYGTPTTIILTKLESGQIGWFSFEGWYPSNLGAEDLDNLINLAVHQNL
jgi:hypothetical protein